MIDASPEKNGSRLTKLLRWICVLPAAVICSWLLNGSLLILLSLLGIDLRGGAYPEFLFPLLQYLPSGFAFIFVGAWIAPDHRIATAFVLAVLSISLSCLTHVLTPTHVGINNMMHVTGETVGVLLGIAATYYRQTRKS